MANFNLNSLFSSAFGVGQQALKELGALAVLQSGLDAARTPFLPFPEVAREPLPAVPTKLRSSEIPKRNLELPTELTLSNQNHFFLAPIPPALEVQSRVNIISTSVAGRNYSIKEIISVEDTRIQVRGIIPPTYSNIISISEGGTVQVKSSEIDNNYYKLLRNLVGEVLSITCPMLNDIDVWSVVVESVNFPDASQYAGVILYQISLVSDVPTELILKDRNLTQNNGI